MLRLPGEDWPYNDLEFYVCLRGNRLLNRCQYGPPLQGLADAMGPAAGLDVEFHICSLAQLRFGAPSMFYYDLIAGQRQLAGPEGLLDLGRHDASRLPISEATRLLMNRGTGLVLARQRLGREPLGNDDADFIGRNIAKAQLGMGDAVLTVYGSYHWSCLERHRRLLALGNSEALPWLDEVRRHHAAGVEFKLHPRRSQPNAKALCDDYEQVAALMLPVWLWVESRRLGREFQSARDYVTNPSDKWPETSPWRNLLLNFWLYGPAAGLCGRGWRHPRARVLTALTILLWDNADAETRVPAALRIGWRTRPVAAAADPVVSYRRAWEPAR